MCELSQAYGLDVDYIGGVVLSGSATGWMGRLAWVLDRVLLKVHSTLADELVIKLRKPDKP
jgi:hypothetical protein